MGWVGTGDNANPPKEVIKRGVRFIPRRGSSRESAARKAASLVSSRVSAPAADIARPERLVGCPIDHHGDAASSARGFRAHLSPLGTRALDAVAPTRPGGGRLVGAVTHADPPRAEGCLRSASLSPSVIEVGGFVFGRIPDGTPGTGGAALGNSLGIDDF
jgi:hypothetical protein